MTNVELIAAAMKMNDITEESHTFNKWKELGYIVRKGEHAAFRATIWKPAKRKKQDGDEEPDTHMFMKTACFFTRSQVEEN